VILVGLLIVLCVLLAIALTAPFVGADTRFPGASTRPDRPRAGKRYRRLWDSAIAEEVHRDQFDATS
jgi:hypothetical protein